MSIDPAMLSNVKPPPHSNEAEQSLLGAVMLNPKCYDLVADRVRPEWFYRENHRLIWQAVDEITRQGQEADAVTVTNWFGRKELLDRVENGAYVTMLANEVPGTSNVRGWARIVEDKHRRRRLIEAATQIQDAAWSADDPLEQSIRHLHDLESQDAGEAVTMAQATAAWLDHMDQLSRGDVVTVDTGLIDVDRQIRRLMGGNLIIVAGRPGTGKTIFGLQVARHNARQGRPTMIFSVEMTYIELVARAVSGGGVKSDRLFDPNDLTPAEWQIIHQVVGELKTQHNLWIDETPELSIEQLRIRARRAKRLHGLELVVVDYLQLLKASRRTNNREQEVAEISRGLKAIAKELNVPVIALAQLNRELEKRTGAARRPVLADLRESGSIEADADIIQMLYLNGQYDENDTSGILEVITRKHRNGPTGTSLVGYQPERFRTVNADLQEIAQYRRDVLDANQARRPNRKKPFDLEDY